MAVDSVVLSIAHTDKQRKLAAEFIARELKRWYQCLPTPLPETVIIAESGCEIVGSIISYFSEDDAPLPLEAIYEFDYHKLPFPFDRKHVVQFSRWITIAEGVSRFLLHAAIKHALSRGRSYGMGETKPRIADIFASMGITLHHFPAIIRTQNIPEEIRPYYEIPPKPTPCMLSLDGSRDVLEPEVLQAVAHSKLNIALG